ncbi:MAG: hypothetical protein ACKOBX_09060 [Bacteroidota bacterium]
MGTSTFLGTALFFSSIVLIAASCILEGKLAEAICESLSLLTAVVSFNLLTPKKQVK